MKILFCCNEYPPSKFGGIGTVTKTVAEELVNRGNDVFVVGTYAYSHPYFGNGSRPEFQKINGVSIYNRTHFKYQKYLPYFLRKSIRFLFRIILVEHFLTVKAISNLEDYISFLIDKHAIEVLEFTDYFPLNKSLRYNYDFKKFSVFTTMRIHGSCSFIDYHKKGHLNNTLKKADIRHILRTDLILSTSYFSSKFIREKLNISNEMVTIYNPIKIDSDNLNQFDENSRDILYFGKITRTKGIFKLVEAFSKVVQSHRSYRLIIIGTGEVEALKKDIDPLISESFKFLGYVSDEDLVREIDNSFICVLPSYFENFSMAALEVLARKRVLIYTKRASGPELISDGENGYLVDPDDVDELSEKIIFLIQNKDIAKHIANNGYKHCLRNFNTPVIVKKLEDIYKSRIV